jgi:acetate kinase
LAFLGVALDNERNRSATGRIESTGSKPVLIIPADEESMIRSLCQSFID